MTDTTYADWCEHYDYDPETERAAEDWERYLSERAVFDAVAYDNDDNEAEVTPGNA